MFGLCVHLFCLCVYWWCALNRVQSMFYYRHLVKFCKYSLVCYLPLYVRKIRFKSKWNCLMSLISSWFSDVIVVGNCLCVCMCFTCICGGWFLLCLGNCIVYHNFCGHHAFSSPFSLISRLIWMLSFTFHSLPLAMLVSLAILLGLDECIYRVKRWLFYIYVNIRFTGIQEISLFTMHETNVLIFSSQPNFHILCTRF